MNQNLRPDIYEYSVVDFLGEGRFSLVYKAERTLLRFNIKTVVAIKILKSKKEVPIWRSEWEALSRVQSPYCVQLYSWETFQSRPGLVLEYVDGVTLHHLVKYKKLSSQMIEAIVLQIYKGLTDLSQSSVVHGDLNLKNVMLTRQGRVKLLDYGVNQGGTKAYTPAFAPPEARRGERLTFQSDLYSLGKIEHHLYKRAQICSPRLLFSGAIRESLRSRTRPLNLPALTCLGVEDLAESVRDLDTNSEAVFTKKLKTSSFVAKDKLFSRSYLFTVLIFMLIISGSVRSARPPMLSFVTVRTQNWVQLRLNKSAWRFAPLNQVQVPAGRLVVRWKSATGRGESTLTLKGVQHIFLTDAFFSTPR